MPDPTEQITLGPFTIKYFPDHLQIRYTPGASSETSHVLTSQELDRTFALVRDREIKTTHIPAAFGVDEDGVPEDGREV